MAGAGIGASIAKSLPTPFSPLLGGLAGAVVGGLIDSFVSAIPTTAAYQLFPLQQLSAQFQLRTGEIIMAHQLEQMAYVGETPWHGLGNQLTQDQPIEVWAQQAGMDWRIESSDVSYMAKNDRGQSIIMPYEEQRVLYRSDTHAPLSVVSQRFQEVQPKEILEFYRDLTEQSGFELETAGVLKGGKKVLGFGTYRTEYSLERQGCQQWLYSTGNCM